MGLFLTRYDSGPTVLVNFNCQHARIPPKATSVKDCLNQVPLSTSVGVILVILFEVGRSGHCGCRHSVAEVWVSCVESGSPCSMCPDDECEVSSSLKSLRLLAFLT